MAFFINLFSSILIFLDSIFGNIGITIIVFTILTRLILLPLTLPSIKSGKKLKELQPELNKLKEKHKNDKQALAMAQAQLYKSYNINPIAGCLPQLLQFFFLIILYQAIIRLFSHPEAGYNLSFLWANLGEKDGTYVFPVIAGITQFLLSLMISPATQTRDIVPNQSKSKDVQAANRKEEDVAEMAATMQQQMIFMMPIMTIFIGLRLPAGLALYWITGTIFTMVTQFFISGWGGIAVYWNRYIAAKGPLKGKFLPVTTGKSLTEIPKKIHLKKEPIFKQDSKNTNLANMLKTLGGSNEVAKPKNIRATKSKKTKRKKK